MNRLIKSTALGLSVLMGCSLCACGVTDSSLGQKTEINPGLWVEKEVALEPDSSDILALTTTTDGQLLCATVQSNGEASQKVDVLSSSDGYTWDTTPVYSVEVPGTCIEASLTESGVLVLIRTEDEEQIWYGAKETECSQVQPADSEVTDINNIQFVNSDSFLMAGRDTNNQSVAAIFSLRDGRMVTKVGAGTEWGGFAQHGDELAFISETGKLSTLKANGEIQEGNVEGLENIIAAYCDSQGNYYYADSEGIYRVAAGGTLKEEITPSSGFAFSVQGKVITNLVYFQDSFFCVVKDTSDDSAQLYSYTFDPDATPSEQIELTVWSLSDSPTVRRVLSEYQQQHNDIAIQYTVAGSDDLATEDVLKALNTELLAGSGPDLIVFDGIDATSVDLDSIHLRRFPNGDRLFDGLKYILGHSYSLSLLGVGGLYPAALARSLAALRRSSLYGSRTDTQRLGTVKVCRSFFTIRSGYFSASRRSFSRSRGSWV